MRIRTALSLEKEAKSLFSGYLAPSESWIRGRVIAPLLSASPQRQAPMTCHLFSNAVRASLFLLMSAFAVCPKSFAQGPYPDAPTPVAAPVAPLVVNSQNVVVEHKFWDKENRALFLTAAALNGADFAVTRANLQSGGQELNPIVRIFGRSTAALALNFAGETAGVVSLSYFFHKTGHHRLERAVSVVNISASVGAVSFGLTHR